MTRLARLLLSSLVVTAIHGCGTLPDDSAGAQVPALEIRGLVIQNRSYGTLSEVVLLVVPTGEFISCGNISMRGQCSTTFPLRRYAGNDVEIRWQEGGREWSSGNFRIDPGAEIDFAYPALIRVIITPAGTAVTEVIQ